MAATVKIAKVQFLTIPPATPAKVKIARVTFAGIIADPAHVNIGRVSFIGSRLPMAVNADAGTDQPDLEPWDICTLVGSNSTADNLPLTYLWEQEAGTTVVMSSPIDDDITFELPGTLDGDTLTFRLTVTDSIGGTDIDRVTVTVLPVTETIVIDGVEQPIHWMTVGT